MSSSCARRRNRLRKTRRAAGAAGTTVPLTRLERRPRRSNLAADHRADLAKLLVLFLFALAQGPLLRGLRSWSFAWHICALLPLRCTDRVPNVSLRSSV